MTEIFVIFILCALLAWTDYNNRKERKSLLNMIKAKDAAELLNLELADKTEIKVDKQKQNDLTEVKDLSEEDFNKFILGKKK